MLLLELAYLKAFQNIIICLTGAGDESFLTLDIKVKASDGAVQPVTSSASNVIGPEGGKVEFSSSDVSLRVQFLFLLLSFSKHTWMLLIFRQSHPNMK